jgi:hypothetical protein
VRAWVLPSCHPHGRGRYGSCPCRRKQPAAFPTVWATENTVRADLMPPNSGGAACGHGDVLASLLGCVDCSSWSWRNDAATARRRSSCWFCATRSPCRRHVDGDFGETLTWLTGLPDHGRHSGCLARPRVRRTGRSVVRRPPSSSVRDRLQAGSGRAGFVHVPTTTSQANARQSSGRSPS